MTWEKEVTELIRVYINDMDEPYTYADTRLERLSVAAATRLVQEISFDNNYIIDISNCSISPDPTLFVPKDNVFMALLALKSAVLLATGEAKQAAQENGINVKDGPASINTLGRLDGFSKILKTFSDDYEYLKLNYKLAYVYSNAQAIMTATTYQQIYGNPNVLSY